MGSLTALTASDRAATPSVYQKSAFQKHGPENSLPPRARPNRDSPDKFHQAYDRSVYRKQTQSLSLSARFAEIAARLNPPDPDTSGASTSEVNAQQLQFDFFSESRIEEVTQFLRRSEGIAEDLDGARRASYVSVSQSIAARFEFSLSMSASSLNGFNNSAESFVDTDELFGELLNYAQGLLDAADSLFNEFFDLFDRDEDEDFSFSDLFQQLRAALLSGDLFGDAGGSAGVAFQLEFSFEISGSITVETGAVQQADPLVFDLDGDGIELTSHTNGARFDLLGDGKAVDTAFVTGGDAFLALDRNGDGLINSGKELFGEQHGAANGYEELKKLDSNNDGVIDKNDEAFDALVLFRDNGNGITEDGELLTLADAGIESINLDYIGVDRRAAGGNRLAQLATFRRTNGTLGRTADALLNYTA